MTNSPKLAQAEALLARGQFREVHVLCLETLQENEREAHAFFLLGVIAGEHNNFRKAEELFARAVDLAPQDARYHAHRAKALVGLQRRAEARAAAEQAAALGAPDALTFDTIGVVLSYAGDHERAAAAFAEAVARDGGNANFWNNLAVSQQFAGDFDAARIAFGRALEIEPGRRGALTGLVQLTKQTRDANHLSELEAQFAGESDANARLMLGHAIAKTYEDLGEWEMSLRWLIEGKAAKRAALGYRAESEWPVFEAAMEAARAARGKTGDDTREPIFIVGMPRSGTTLCDRILSNHSQVRSAGELDHIAALINTMSGRRAEEVMRAETLRGAGGLDLAALGRSYVETARPRAGNAAPRFIDKMPRNFLYAGLIAWAMPHARIICLRRDPMDTALSNYRQVFNAESAYYRYTYDMEEAARYVVMFERLVTHWRETLPPERYTEVRYEDLVANLEGETRRLLDFCGLPFEQTCLDFTSNDAPVATASSVQVRQPLYASSIGRWRRYGDALAPMQRVFADSGLA